MGGDGSECDLSAIFLVLMGHVFWLRIKMNSYQRALMCADCHAKNFPFSIYFNPHSALMW